MAMAATTPVAIHMMRNTYNGNGSYNPCGYSHDEEYL